MVDVDERGFGKLPQRVRRDHDDLPAERALDPHAIALELAVGGPVLAEREQRCVAIGWRQLDVHGFRPVRMRGEARGGGRVLGVFARPVTPAIGRDGSTRGRLRRKRSTYRASLYSGSIPPIRTSVHRPADRAREEIVKIQKRSAAKFPALRLARADEVIE